MPRRSLPGSGCPPRCTVAALAAALGLLAYDLGRVQQVVDGALTLPLRARHPLRSRKVWRDRGVLADDRAVHRARHRRSPGARGAGAGRRAGLSWPVREAGSAADPGAVRAAPVRAGARELRLPERHRLHPAADRSPPVGVRGRCPATPAEDRYIEQRDRLALGDAGDRYLSRHTDVSGGVSIEDDWPRRPYLLVGFTRDVRGEPRGAPARRPLPAPGAGEEGALQRARPAADQ